MSPATPRQVQAICDLVRDAILNLKTDKESATRILRKPDKLKSAATEAFQDIGGMRHRRQQCSSIFRYPVGFVVKPIAEQVLTLKGYPLFEKLDPTLALVYSKNLPQVPRGMDGNFVIPRWELIGKTYDEAVRCILQELKREYGVKSILEGPGSSSFIVEQHEHSQQAFEFLRAKQPGDFLVFSAQMGILHGGRSTFFVRDILLPKEFCLGPYEAGVIFLTHPKLLVYADKSRNIICPGGRCRHPMLGHEHQYVFEFTHNIDNEPLFAFTESWNHGVSGGVATGFLN